MPCNDLVPGGVGRFRPSHTHTQTLTHDALYKYIPSSTLMSSYNPLDLKPTTTSTFYPTTTTTESNSLMYVYKKRKKKNWCCCCYSHPFFEIATLPPPKRRPSSGSVQATPIIFLNCCRFLHPLVCLCVRYTSWSCRFRSLFSLSSLTIGGFIIADVDASGPVASPHNENGNYFFIDVSWITRYPAPLRWWQSVSSIECERKRKKENKITTATKILLERDLLSNLRSVHTQTPPTLIRWPFGLYFPI